MSTHDPDPSVPLPVPRTVGTTWPLSEARCRELAPAFAASLAPLLGDRPALELRAPHCRVGDAVRDVVRVFTGPHRLTALAADALRASGHCPGVYVVLNPTRPGGRRAGATADADVTRRTWLPIDVDPVRPRHASATDAEKAAAYRTAVAVRDELARRGWPPPLVADSGNGYHLFARLDRPNDAASRELVRACLRALAARFDGDGVTVDTRVFNASRLMKVPGTAAGKGDNTSDRPHRTGGWIDPPADVAVVPRSLLEDLAAEAPPEPPAPNRRPTPPRPAAAPPADDQVVRLGERCYGDKFGRLWAGDTSGHGGDHSRADLALAGYLAWLVGPDEGRVLDLFRRSGLSRAKWDAVHAADGSTYGQMTVRKALASMTSFRGDRPPPTSRRAAPDGPPDPPPNPPPEDAVPPDPDPAPSASPPTDPLSGDAPDDPHRLARSYLATLAPAGAPLPFRYHAGEYLEWRHGAYDVVPEDEVRARLTAHTRAALEAAQVVAHAAWVAHGDGKEPTTHKVTTRLVADVLNAVRSLTLLPADQTAPRWVGRDGPDPRYLLALRNGILDVRSGELLPPSAHFFTRAAADYEFDPDAPPPARWLRFLAEVSPDDPEAVRCLRQMFGYLLTADTRHQKSFLLAGATRSGKGTILKLLRRLVGPRSYAGTTLASLAEPFGLQSLVGKTVAGVPDAQFAGRAEAMAAVVERLKSVSTGEPVEVPRKFLGAVTVPLCVRFVIACNRVPALDDASGALAGRFVVLPFTRSFLGREETDLDEALAAELPGVLNWAVGGWADLTACGGFAEPASGLELKDSLTEAGSPVGAFVRDCCVVSPSAEVAVADLYAAYRRWCAAAGERAEPQARFGTAVRAAVPSLRPCRPNRSGANGRQRLYRGLRLTGPDDRRNRAAGEAGVGDHPTSAHPTGDAREAPM